MTSDNIIKVLHYLEDWVTAIPAHQWYIFGTVVASIPVVIGIVEWVKNHHFNVKAQELETHFIYLNIAFWATVMTCADFVITNGSHFATFLPFLAKYMPVITAAAPAIYSFAKAANSWFSAHKKPSFASQLPDLPQDPNLGKLVQEVTTPVPQVTSTTTAPPTDVFSSIQ